MPDEVNPVIAQQIIDEVAAVTLEEAQPNFFIRLFNRFIGCFRRNQNGFNDDADNRFVSASNIFTPSSQDDLDLQLHGGFPQGVPEVNAITIVASHQLLPNVNSNNVPH